ncbi:hypothetical protein [Antarcticirhabdus aurantiaca]|uniref:Uncharacterized protein n=1 Tax=Antarcticirhabdus aurantiaca TaxID=2606717 RepID=A0ACD4NMZ7_9HYPH|nr:hypothetical protein [Antarcticirhabdus aurantiaca]WAJ28241.1 hypothetical protein OXU80_26050 [Jeongeuplla avenae]
MLSRWLREFVKSIPVHKSWRAANDNAGSASLLDYWFEPCGIDEIIWCHHVADDHSVIRLGSSVPGRA